MPRNSNNRTKNNKRSASRKNQRSNVKRAPRARPEVIMELRRQPTYAATNTLTAVRSAANVLFYGTNSGWNATSRFDLSFAFTQNTIQVYSGGSVISSWSVPGATDFTPLFQWWRINYVDFQLFSGATNFGANNTPAVPPTNSQAVWNLVFDPNDTDAISLSSILQYENLRTVTLPVNRSVDGLVLRFRPTPLVGGAQVGSTAVRPAFRPEKVRANPWVDMAQLSIPHYGVKTFLDVGMSQSGPNDYIQALSCYVHISYSFCGTV